VNVCVCDVGFVVNVCVCGVGFVVNVCVCDVGFVVNVCVCDVGFVVNVCVCGVGFVVNVCVCGVGLTSVSMIFLLDCWGWSYSVDFFVFHFITYRYLWDMQDRLFELHTADKISH
jgi:hypothetical protein